MKQRQVTEPELIAEAAELPRLTDVSKINSRVVQAYQLVGKFLDDEKEDAVLLVDALCFDCPIIGISEGFTKLTGFPREQVIGRNCRLMLGSVPEVSISKSVRKNLRDFVRMCRLRDLDRISEVSSLQPNCRTNGTHFMNLFMIGRVMVRHHPFLLGVQTAIGEGPFVKLSGKDMEKATEASRQTFQRFAARLRPAEEPLMHEPSVHQTSPFRWYGDRLQDHCCLLHNRRTALRREPQELATNCLVFGDTPIRRSADGLFFAIAINDAVTTFEGLPLVGFTKRKPQDKVDLYPTVSRCLGLSVLIGSSGEAFARDKLEHFRIGFKQPPQEEVQSWTTQPHLQPHKRRPPVNVTKGDVLGCLYTNEGRLQLWHNGALVLDFDVERPVDQAADYYAVADVALSTYSVTVLPLFSTKQLMDSAPYHSASSEVCKHQASAMPSFFACDAQETPVAKADSLLGQTVAVNRSIDEMMSHVINHGFLKNALRNALMNCQFCVSIADPKGIDIPFVAVSEAFECMTGFARSEILGMNCRFLNQGCPVSALDLMGLRLASESGSPFTALLPNKKKSGEMFVNLLDLRGLTIAKHTQTGEELWYLIGIQADVTGLAHHRIPEDHLSALQEVAQNVRAKLRKELSMLAADGFQASTPGGWQLLEEPFWRNSSEAARPARGLTAAVVSHHDRSNSGAGSSQDACRGISRQVSTASSSRDMPRKSRDRNRDGELGTAPSTFSSVPQEGASAFGQGFRHRLVLICGISFCTGLTLGRYLRKSR